MKIGYARASARDQNTTIQVEALERDGCAVVRQEKASGTSTKGRTEVAAILEFIRTGDVLVVTRLDRLARSNLDLHLIANRLKERGAALRVIEQGVDTSTSAGRAFFGLLATFAEFETDVRKDRQMEGIAKAKTAGVYKGRKPSIDANAVQQLLDQGIGPAAVARRLKIGRASVYRVKASRPS